MGDHEHKIQVDTADVGYLFYQAVDYFFNDIISNQNKWYSKLAGCCRHRVTASSDLEDIEILAQAYGVDQSAR